MTYGNVNVETVTTSTPGGILGAGNASIMKNRIINGAMTIDQRNSGASVTPSNAQYLTDRFSALLTQSSKFSAQQNAGSVTPPAGFTNYLGITSLSAYSIGSGDAFGVLQKIEGYNVADLGWGTANAKTVTLSFWIRSSLTGTFGGSILNSDVSRSYPFTYTVSSANTWTQISITIVGDTSGTWLTTNGIGLNINFSLGTGATYNGTAGSWAGAYYLSATGATSVVGTNGATFYITGVQLEVGSSATGFEYRQYGQELALCQRYAYIPNSSGNVYTTFAVGYVYNSTLGLATITFPVTMRVTPTFASSGNFQINAGSSTLNSSALSLNQGSPYTAVIGATISGGTTGYGASLSAQNTSSALLTFSAEL